MDFLGQDYFEKAEKIDGLLFVKLGVKYIVFFGDGGIVMDENRFALIKAVIMRAWAKETASPLNQENWTEENPSLGQCAVTALLVHETMGGYIMRTVVPGLGSHYYNVLPDGSVCDLTRGQFPPGTIVPSGEAVEREGVLGSERAKAARTQERYALLVSRFMDILLGMNI